MNRKDSFLFIILMAINIAAAGVDVWARTEIFRASPLAPGHLIAATNALTRDSVRDILLGRRCHVIHYSSSTCPACISNQGEWASFRDAMIKSGCEVVAVDPGGPGPRLAEDDRNAERLIAVTPGFEAATQMVTRKL